MHLSRCARVVIALCACGSGATAQVADGPRAKPAEAGRGVPPTSAPLGLVASGKRLALSTWGDARSAKGVGVHVCGPGFSARAEADGFLIQDGLPEPCPTAPFDAKTETVSYAGAAPTLFAFRRKNVACLVRDEAAVLVLHGPTWREIRLPGRQFPPHAFVAWAGGALIVDSQMQGCGWATSSPVERLSRGAGTSFTQVAPTGTLTHPTLGLDPTFMAWGASSAGDTLTLVGTYGVRAGARTPAIGSHDIVVMRRQGQGPFKASAIVKTEGRQAQSVRTQVREFGAAALLWPPPIRDDGTPVTGAVAEAGDEMAWQGHASSVFRIADGKVTELKFRSASQQDCSARDATLVGEDVYVILACPEGPARLVRASADGQPALVELSSPPKLAPCSPIRVLGRAPDDLWVHAQCGPIERPAGDALFRLGHVQRPLTAPQANDDN